MEVLWKRGLYMKQDNMLAMILAGGRGTRLHDLTKKVAKPAVSYGGKYRIIDFPLSNCANSGIDIVGVLTQYESVLLNSYAAAGRRWGLDAKDSGVYILITRLSAKDTNASWNKCIGFRYLIYLPSDIIML